MYYLYGKINRGHGICPLYGGCPLLGESAIRGFTVYLRMLSERADTHPDRENNFALSEVSTILYIYECRCDR